MGNAEYMGIKKTDFSFNHYRAQIFQILKNLKKPHR